MQGFCPILAFFDTYYITNRPQQLALQGFFNYSVDIILTIFSVTALSIDADFVCADMLTPPNYAFGKMPQKAASLFVRGSLNEIIQKPLPVKGLKDKALYADGDGFIDQGIIGQ